MLAAGVALSALSGAIGGGDSGSSGGGDSGGGIASSPSTTTEVTNSQKAAEPTTKVQLVVQGSIYDSDDTATRLVSLLNDSALKNGSTLIQGKA
jgi:hypothetical protein